MISSKNVRLRAPERKDIPQWVAWLNDPEVTAGLYIVYPVGMEDETGWFDNIQKTPPAEHPMVIDIKVGETWVTVGNCGVHKIDWRVRCAEVGIFIGEKRYWNLGVGTETMRLLVQYCFETLNMNRVFLQVFANNKRAVRVYEKVGFIKEGCQRQAEYKNGEYIDVIIMGILRSEWTPPVE
jgi:RimJ/RimL family protein N-acetyltransferase